MEKHLCLMFVLFTLSSALNLQGNGCPKPKKTYCEVSATCPEGQACLGPPENRFCRDCRCNQKSQCYLESNNVNCNCTNSGHTGDHCECKKDDHSDIVYWHSHCSKFSNEFLILDNGYWSGDCSMAQKFFTKNKTFCFSQCESIQTCYLVFYDGFPKVCNLFISENPPMLGSIMEKVVRAEWNSPSEIHIRNCIERVLDSDENE